ncbi:hypothetical protein D3C80_1227930 [compost metagenome]
MNKITVGKVIDWQGLYFFLRQNGQVGTLIELTAIRIDFVGQPRGFQQVEHGDGIACPSDSIRGDGRKESLGNPLVQCITLRQNDRIVTKIIKKTDDYTGDRAVEMALHKQLVDIIRIGVGVIN